MSSGKSLIVVLCGLICFLPQAVWASETSPFGTGWAAKGVQFLVHCFDGGGEGNSHLPPCKPQRITSPDGKSAVEIFYRLVDGADRYAFFRVLRPGLPPHIMQAQDEDYSGSVAELLWAPNSRAFFVNGDDSAAAGYYVNVFLLNDPALKPIDPTGPASREMARSLLWMCPWAADRRFLDCQKYLHEQGFNMSGVDWLPDSSGIALFGQVPESSGYGVLMSQSRGYEVAIPTGRIKKAMTTLEFKARWQGSADWKILEPPSLKMTLAYLKQAKGP